jgi:hypothetical protein
MGKTHRRDRFSEKNEKPRKKDKSSKYKIDFYMDEESDNIDEIIEAKRKEDTPPEEKI